MLLLGALDVGFALFNHILQLKVVFMFLHLFRVTLLTSQVWSIWKQRAEPVSKDNLGQLLNLFLSQNNKLVLLFSGLYCMLLMTPCFVHHHLLCMGTTGVCGGEGAERTAGGGVLDLPSPSDVGPEPLRTEPSRSANLVAAGFRREGGRDVERDIGNSTNGTVAIQTSHSLRKCDKRRDLWDINGKDTCREAVIFYFNNKDWFKGEHRGINFMLSVWKRYEDTESHGTESSSCCCSISDYERENWF